MARVLFYEFPKCENQPTSSQSILVTILIGYCIFLQLHAVQGFKRATSRQCQPMNLHTLLGLEVSLCDSAIGCRADLPTKSCINTTLRLGLFGMHPREPFHVQNDPRFVPLTLVAPRSSCTCFDLPAVRVPVTDATKPETGAVEQCTLIISSGWHSKIQFGAVAAGVKELCLARTTINVDLLVREQTITEAIETAFIFIT